MKEMSDVYFNILEAEDKTEPLLPDPDYFPIEDEEDLIEYAQPVIEEKNTPLPHELTQLDAKPI